MADLHYLMYDQDCEEYIAFHMQESSNIDEQLLLLFIGVIIRKIIVIYLIEFRRPYQLSQLTIMFQIKNS
jgi:hypothetical protein